MSKIFIRLARLFGIFALLLGILSPAIAHDTLRFGVREDAPPFSNRIVGNLNELSPGVQSLKGFEGLSVDICLRVADRARDRFGYGSTSAVGVTSDTRFDFLSRSQIDLLCDPTSVTESRFAHCEFSFPFFVSGISHLTREGEDMSSEMLGKGPIGYVVKTTTETRIKSEWLRRSRDEVNMIGYSSYVDARNALLDGKIVALYGDRDILQATFNEENPAQSIKLSDDLISIELYAICVSPGNQRVLRLVNETLGGLYRSGEILDLISKHFGGRSPSRALLQLYGFYSVPLD